VPRKKAILKINKWLFLGVNLMNKETINEILKFRDERNWKQYHNPKDLAISISIEAAELLENFQWSTWQEVIEKKKAILQKN